MPAHPEDRVLPLDYDIQVISPTDFPCFRVVDVRHLQLDVRSHRSSRSQASNGAVLVLSRRPFGADLCHQAAL